MCSMFGINKMKDRGNCVEKVIFSIVALVCPEYLIDTHTHTTPRALIYGLCPNPQLFSCKYEKSFYAVAGVWLTVGCLLSASFVRQVEFDIKLN